MSTAPMSHLFARDLKKTFPVIDRGAGVFLYDTSGNRYIDGSGGAAVVTIGHGVREVSDAMARQAARVSFAYSKQFVSQVALDLAAKVVEFAPGGLTHVFFVGSGSEANELALKIARRYHLERGKPEKTKVVSRWQSYHGDTLGALSMTGRVAEREDCVPYLLPFPHIAPAYCYRCPFDKTYPACGVTCATELDRVVQQEGPETIAAFIADPVVGSGTGAIVPPQEYFGIVRQTCDRHDMLFIADEVITGFGRTGKNFGVDHWAVVPDLITTGKGITGGYAPLAAVIVSNRVYRTIAEGSGKFIHGHTYAAHPVMCAAGLSVLNYIERHGLVDRAARMGKYLRDRVEMLTETPIVGDVRGLGLQIGIELVADRDTRTPFPSALRVAARVAERCFANGLILLAGSRGINGVAGDYLMLAPPLTITEEEIETLVGILREGLQAVSGDVKLV